MTFEPERIVLLEGGTTSVYYWTLTEELIWTGDFPGKSSKFSVPAEFETDLASVPKFMTWLFPRYGKYTKAAVLHDHLCRSIGDYPVIKDRSDADEVFRHVMEELEVPPPRRWLMWGAVVWATLGKSLWPGRKSKRLGQVIGLLIASVAVVAALYGTLGPVGDVPRELTVRSRLLSGILTLWVGYLVAAPGVLVAGFIAQGRWDRGAIYLAVLGMTAVFFPFLLAGLVAFSLKLFYNAFEWSVSGQARDKRRAWKASTKAKTAPKQERQAALQAS